MLTTALSALSAGAIAGIVVGSVAGAILLLFLVTFAIYWFNLDMKLMHWLYQKMKKHYDKIERTRRL